MSWRRSWAGGWPGSQSSQSRPVGLRLRAAGGRNTEPRLRRLLASWHRLCLQSWEFGFSTYDRRGSVWLQSRTDRSLKSNSLQPATRQPTPEGSCIFRICIWWLMRAIAATLPKQLACWMRPVRSLVHLAPMNRWSWTASRPLWTILLPRSEAMRTFLQALPFLQMA